MTEVISVKHKAFIIKGEYQFFDKVKSEVLRLLKTCNTIPHNSSNVKASTHTEWDWEPDNITFRNLKETIREEIEKVFQPGQLRPLRRQLHLGGAGQPFAPRRAGRSGALSAASYRRPRTGRAELRGARARLFGLLPQPVGGRAIAFNCRRLCPLPQYAVAHRQLRAL